MTLNLQIFCSHILGYYIITQNYITPWCESYTDALSDIMQYAKNKYQSGNLHIDSIYTDADNEEEIKKEHKKYLQSML